MNDRDDASCVYGLRQQARCLASVHTDSDTSQFLVGTTGPKNDNHLHLLDFDDSAFTVQPALYRHPHEIWDIATCPFDQHRFFTTYTNDDGALTASLWEKEPVDHLEQTMSPRPDSSKDLTLLTTIPTKGLHKVLWAACGEKGRVASVSDTCIAIWSLDSAHENIEKTITWNIDNANEASAARIHNAVWSPHSDEVIATYGSTVAGWDIRSNQVTFERHRAHPASIRAVDYNHNKPHHIVTGGDDAALCIWDTRNLKSPLMEMVNHTHWVRSVAYNMVHDQLILSSSSDTLVNLHSAVSVSSASYMAQSLDTDDESVSSMDQPRELPTDGFLKAYDQHEDSVYSVAWSHSDIWIFASLSYDGRVVINRVPTSEKFKILGI
ncbi:hypothetical protein Unana1_08324 [Umbelopsis nana]